MNHTEEPDYSLDQNTVINLAYFNYAKANKLKVKASKKIKKLLAGMDDNGSRKVNSSIFNKSNKSSDEDVDDNSSEKPKKQCSKCGKWGYHTAEECKAKDIDDKSSRSEEANMASSGKGKSPARRVEKLNFLDYNGSNDEEDSLHYHHNNRIKASEITKDDLSILLIVNRKKFLARNWDGNP